MRKYSITAGFSAVFASSQQSPLTNVDETRSQAANDENAGVTESHDATRASSVEGAFFSNVLRQLMPLISQGRDQQETSASNPSSSTVQVIRSSL